MKNKPKEIFTKPIAQIKKVKICLLFVGKLINSDAINCISRLNQTYFKSFSLTLKVLQRSLITAIMLILLFLTGCMHMEMGMRKKMNMGKITPIKKVQEYNTNDKMDQVISKSVNNLKAQSLDISNIAVWRIRSQSAGLDVDLLRAKLISNLVSINTFQVVSRERLDALLEEQELSLSGVIDSQSAEEIGNLIGIDGFIDGYASFSENLLSLTLHVIETKTGKIVWSRTIQSE